MEWITKYQYSILLFLLSFFIVLLGVIPTGSKLLQRYLLSPDNYGEVRGVISTISPHPNAGNFVSYPVYVTFSVPSPETGELTEYTALLDHYASYMEEGMELLLIYNKENPQAITQEWTQLRDFLLFSSFAVLGYLVGMMMTKPASPEIYVRPQKTLRERLEKY
ncbi:MAG: hypothetical protein R3Y63_02530 [Eubacteriales bacterium]